MTSINTKRGKAAVYEFDGQTKEVRQLLNEHLKCFDSRTEGKVLFLADLQEFFRRLSEIELDYSRNLEKLSERFLDKLQKHRAQRRERMSTMDLWHCMLTETKNRAKQRMVLSDNVANNVVNRFMIMSDDCQRISKKCRETSTILQEELMKSVNELHRRVHRYHTMSSETKTAETKFQTAQNSLQKAEESKRRNEKLVKQFEKNQQRYQECKKKTIKAKNDYVVSLAATNKFMHTYYHKYLAELVDGFDFNYHSSFKWAVEAYVSMESSIAGSTAQSMNSVREVKLGVEPDTDKQYYFDDNHATFSLPFTFSYLPQVDDELCQVSPQQTDIIEHHYKIFNRLKQIKMETDEIEKTVEATSHALAEMHKQWDNEMVKLASGDSDMATVTANCASIKNSSEDLEMYYATKFRELLLTSSLKVRVEAENDTLTRTLGDVSDDFVGLRLKQLSVDIKSPKASAILHSVQKKTKVFGCNLNEYVKVTGKEIPEVVESCVKFIIKFGLEHPGIFRLSGSSTDVNDMKQLFENGRDPLAGLNHWKDINAVAGLLKVYFRELADPLFPSSHYQDFIRTSQAHSVEGGLKDVCSVINSLPEPTFHVMKYLFRFLSLVSRHSEKNKMDAHNLAVVFGPTLLRIPNEQDMIAYQSHVNGMIEFIIKHCGEIFPGDTEPDGPQLSGTEESDSEEDFEPRDATALFDYSARSSKELSFRKGDVIRVYKRFNADWWDGTLKENDGFVPSSYIRLLSEDDPDGGDTDGSLSPTKKTPKGKDAAGPPKVPKREGSLRCKVRPAVAKSPSTESAVILGTSPQSAGAAPNPSSFGKAKAAMPAISSDEILLRQRTLRARGAKDEPPGPGKEAEEDTGLFSRGSLPRLRHVTPGDEVTKPPEASIPEGGKRPEEAGQSPEGPGEGEQPSERRTSGASEERRPSASNHSQATPPASPRTSLTRVPPAVRPKPKASKPVAPDRKESGEDLMVSLHAAQVALSHRPTSPLGPGAIPEEIGGDLPRSRGSVGDNTFL